MNSCKYNIDNRENIQNNYLFYFVENNERSEKEDSKTCVSSLKMKKIK